MSIQAAEGDPGKYAYLRDPRWTTNHPLEVREVQMMPGTCELCVFGRGEHSAGCEIRSAPEWKWGPDEFAGVLANPTNLPAITFADYQKLKQAIVGEGIAEYAERGIVIPR